MHPSLNDLDFVGARLHARRSRLAERDRLDTFCRLPNTAEFGRALYPDTRELSPNQLQQRLVQSLADEVFELAKLLEGPSADLLAWLMVRFQIENIKVLLRNLGTAAQRPEQHLINLPGRLALDVNALLSADSPEQFAARLPAGPIRKTLSEALTAYPDQPLLFFLEGALDCSYFRELLSRTVGLKSEERELLRAIFLHETDFFHLMLALRGKFIYSLQSERMTPLHVRGSGIGADSFKAMLAAPDVRSAASLAIGHALDRLPTEELVSAAPAAAAAAVETLAWRRFLRLNNQAFRRSHMGLAAVIGYIGIRRVEVANLITISEGLRAGIGFETLRAHLHPRSNPTHV